MKRTIAIALLTASTLGQAADRQSGEGNAYACARAVQDETGLAAYEVVKMRAHPGAGRFSIWVNAHNADVGAFCVTANGRVKRTYVQNGHWTGRMGYPGRTTDLAAK